MSANTVISVPVTMRKPSGLFLDLLRAPLNPYEAARTIPVILDNFDIHESGATKAWLAEFGGRLRLQFLPPCCLENRIERSWLDLHANVTRNHQQRTIGALLARVHGSLTQRFDTQRMHSFQNGYTGARDPGTVAGKLAGWVRELQG